MKKILIACGVTLLFIGCVKEKIEVVEVAPNVIDESCVKESHFPQHITITVWSDGFETTNYNEEIVDVSISSGYTDYEWCVQYLDSARIQIIESAQNRGNSNHYFVNGVRATKDQYER